MAKPKDSASSFKKRWAAKERALGFENIAAKLVACGDADLPNEAAPCLSFKDAELMPAIWEVLGPADPWTAKDKNRLEKYRIIGADGAGNPMCVETGSGEIWLLDHEDQFRTTQFVNSGISQLAECLLAYMGEKDPATFLAAIKELDPPAVRKGSFWFQEAVSIGEETD